MIRLFSQMRTAARCSGSPVEDAVMEVLPMSLSRRGAAMKADNEKYVRRGADMVIEHDLEWEDDVRRANEGKVGSPYMYADTLVMMTTGSRVAPGVRYRQLQEMVGRMVGESNTPVFSQLYKRISRLGADINRDPDGVVTVSDKKRTRILALDASGLKQHNRGEWMRAKWKVRRGFVKMHVLVDTETMKILALEVTNDSVEAINVRDQVVPRMMCNTIKRP